MKFFYPAPVLVGMSIKSIMDDFQEAVDYIEYDLTIRKQHITDAVGQSYIDNITKLRDDMIDCDEEDQVDAKLAMAMKVMKKHKIVK